MLFFDLHV
ncbi:hypothetical protein D047_2785A, partial [Vibrio parahaemolyticus VPTS-2010_2]